MKYLISIVGATAIGKTKLSIALAKHFSCEIISADSRQFFKEMYIGTAVPSEEELQAVPHHFIQNKSVNDAYSVGDFEKEALAKLDELFQENNIVIMVGGSGLYVDAVLNGLDDFPKINPKIRKELNKQLTIDGLEGLQAQLEYLDPDTYSIIDKQNPHRVIRALEVCLGTDNTYSYYKNRPKITRDFIPIKIGLQADRELIYQRIEDRVDRMIEGGLVNEAKQLFPFKELNALKTVGYRELFNYFEKKHSLEVAVTEIKKNTRRFAKRQLTWFRKDKEIQWFDYKTDISRIINYISEKINLSEKN